MRRIITAFCLLASLCFGQSVTTTEFYDDREALFIWRGDDMGRSVGHVDTDRFIDMANFLAERHIVFSAALKVGFADTSCWSAIQSQMETGLFQVGSHAYGTDANSNLFYHSYIESRQKIYDNLTLDPKHTYNGQEYMNAFYQFGGNTNFLPNTVQATLASGNYLINHSYLVYSTGGMYYFDWPTWDATNGLYNHSGLGLGMTPLLDGTYEERKNDPLWGQCPDWAVSNRKVLSFICHPYRDNEWVLGTNAPAIAAFADDWGNRKNVWYSDPNTAYTYLFLQTRADLAISCAPHGSGYMMSVSANHEERVKYGLSVPLTYKFSKPPTWVASAGCSVYYRDTVDTDWVLMTEKTTNDYFTDINCFRDAVTNVYISQGLPQASDSFEVKIVPKKHFAPSFFFSIVGKP